MCYFLYGAINEDVNLYDYSNIPEHKTFIFNVGSYDKIIQCVENNASEYRITRRMCDCETAVGKCKTGKLELRELSDYIHKLKSIRGIKHIYISKNWYSETNETEETVHIDDIDLVPYLANIKDNCLCKIQLFKRYY